MTPALLATAIARLEGSPHQLGRCSIADTNLRAVGNRQRWRPKIAECVGVDSGELFTGRINQANFGLSNRRIASHRVVHRARDSPPLAPRRPTCDVARQAVQSRRIPARRVGRIVGTTVRVPGDVGSRASECRNFRATIVPTAAASTTAAASAASAASATAATTAATTATTAAARAPILAGPGKVIGSFTCLEVDRTGICSATERRETNQNRAPEPDENIATVHESSLAHTLRREPCWKGQLVIMPASLR